MKNQPLGGVGGLPLITEYAMLTCECAYSFVVRSNLFVCLTRLYHRPNDHHNGLAECAMRLNKMRGDKEGAGGGKGER